MRLYGTKLSLSQWDCGKEAGLYQEPIGERGGGARPAPSRPRGGLAGSGVGFRGMWVWQWRKASGLRVPRGLAGVAPGRSGLAPSPRLGPPETAPPCPPPLPPGGASRRPGAAAVRRRRGTRSTWRVRGGGLGPGVCPQPLSKAGGDAGSVGTLNSDNFERFVKSGDAHFSTIEGEKYA